MKKIILSILMTGMILFTGLGSVSAMDFSVLNSCTISQDNITALTGMSVTGCTSPCMYDDSAGGAKNCGACCLLSAVMNLTNWVFIALITISALMIIYGAYCFVMAGADPAKSQQGRSLLMYAAIGIAVAFFSKALPTLVSMVMGVR